MQFALFLFGDKVSFRGYEGEIIAITLDGTGQLDYMITINESEAIAGVLENEITLIKRHGADVCCDREKKNRMFFRKSNTCCR